MFKQYMNIDFVHSTMASNSYVHRYLCKNIYSLLSLSRIPRDWTKYVELSVVRGNQIMTYGYNFWAK